MNSKPVADPGFEPTQSDCRGSLVTTLLYNVIRDTMGQCVAKWENTERTSKPGQEGQGTLFRGDNF